MITINFIGARANRIVDDLHRRALAGGFDAESVGTGSLEHIDAPEGFDRRRDFVAKAYLTPLKAQSNFNLGSRARRRIQKS